MWLSSILDFLSPRSPHARTRRRLSPRQRPAATRLTLEALEDRCLLNFSPAVGYPAFINPAAVLTADFNGDGRLDLAVFNNFYNSASVLLGKGDGTFQPALTSTTGDGPQSFAVGDFNGDGKLDLVTANTYDVSVLLGNGDGTFGAPSSIGLGLQSYPSSVAVGDFNGDGKLDLGVTSSVYVGPAYGGHFEGKFNVLLGNGDGTFRPAITTSVANGGAVALADFNGDKKLDVVLTSSGASVLLGNGDGTFGAATDFSTGNSPRSVAVADVNDDGKLDLVTASPYGDSVSVLLGDGLGSFGAAQSYAVGATPNSVAVGDFNADGKPDLVTASPGSYPGYAGSVSVLLGNGDGAFRLAGVFAAGSYPQSVAVGDFNGDALPDVAVANYTSDTVSVLLNAADWSATPVQASSFVVSGFPSPATAGTAGTFTVTAENAGGTTATGYTGTVHFTSSDAQAGLPADYTFTAADAGVHAFSATLKTAGTQSFMATDTTIISLTVSEAGITVNPAVASHLAVSAPAGSTAGSAFSVTLTARDPYNNIAIGYTGAVHFTSTDGQASLLGDYTFTNADAGVYTFTNGVILRTAGSQTVAASDTVTSSISGSAAVTVSPAAASTMTVAGFPSPTTAGVAGSFTVTLKDPYGNIASGYMGTIHFTSTDGKAVLPANYTFTAADAGRHTFSATLKTAGTQSLTVTDTTTAGLTGTDGGIMVKPAAASQFIITGPSSVSAGVPFSLTLTVEDAYGNVVTGYTGTIHFTSTDKTATLPKNYTFTAADKGVHAFSGLVLRKKGTQKITLTDTLNSSLMGSVIENVL